MFYQSHALPLTFGAQGWRRSCLTAIIITSGFHARQAGATPQLCATLVARSRGFKVEPVYPPKTTEILDQLAASSGLYSRANPTSIKIEDLRVGQKLYVSARTLRHTPGIAADNAKTTIMTVVQKPSPESSEQPNRQIFHLESPETGRVPFESWQLDGDVFSDPHPEKFAPFVPGEYVQIGSEYSSFHTYKSLNNPNFTVGFSGNAAPYIGKFVRILDDQNYVVRVVSTDGTMPATDLIVKRTAIYGLASGTATHFKNSLRRLLSVPISFKGDELVRYRRSDGTMALGFFVRGNERYITVKDEFDRNQYVSTQSVFRYLGGKPHTVVYRAKWMQAYFSKPTGMVKQFLDGAGKLSSLNDFSKMSHDDKVRTLTKYLTSQVRPTKAATSIEFAGLQHFDDILCAGAGVCRHLSVLMAVMLGELGYSPRLTTYAENGNDGHAWVEVDVNKANGQVETLIVDPSQDEYVQSLGRVSASAAKDRDSFEAKWYTQPERKFLVMSSE